MYPESSDIFFMIFVMDVADSKSTLFSSLSVFETSDTVLKT